MKKLNTIELFVGCGGLLDGFEKANYYNTIVSVEWAKQACNTLIKRLTNKYDYENASERVLHFDIQRTDELINGWSNDKKYGTNEGLKSIIGEKSIDVIVGGPPCQAYSLAGRIRDKNGMKNDYRNYLFESYLRVVSAFNPKLLVFENVEGLLSATPNGEKIVDKIRKGFSDIGFDIIDDIKSQALLDLSQFGVPQKRKRVILIGLNREYFGSSEENKKILNQFYNDILESYKSEQISTVYETINDMPKIFPTSEEFKANGRMRSHSPINTEIDSHSPRYHNKRDIEIFRSLAEDISSGMNRYQSVENLKKLYSEKTGKSSSVHKYYVLRWNQPSNTIPAHLKKDGLRHIHPDPKQARSITVREAARLQTFDDDFEFTGSMMQNYEMIGNAVPPEFSRRLACAIYELFEKREMV